jgi:valyl-tRNA synthetase
MAALIKGAKSVTVDKDLSRVLSGCASEAVGADIIVHLLVKVLLIITHPGLNWFSGDQGLANIDVEMAKAEKKMMLARKNIESMSKNMAAADYEFKVGEHVRRANSEKVKLLLVLFTSCSCICHSWSSWKNSRLKKRRWKWH